MIEINNLEKFDLGDEILFILYDNMDDINEAVITSVS